MTVYSCCVRRALALGKDLPVNAVLRFTFEANEAMTVFGAESHVLVEKAVMDDRLRAKAARV
jgi:hypothetical protein